MKPWYYRYNKVFWKCFCLLAALPALGADNEARVTSVVRADPRTGRLVRSVVVNPKYLPARTDAPQAVNAPNVKPAPQVPGEIGKLIENAARQHAVDPQLVHAVIQVESNYNPNAVSPKGAVGIMQLIPSTARRLGVSNSFDVRQNIEAGVRYLKYLQDTFRDDRLALAAYNAGEGAVLKYKDVPPYPETEQYVYQVGKKWSDARRAAGAAEPAAEAPPAVPKEPPVRSLEAVTDGEGRIYWRTRQ